MVMWLLHSTLHLSPIMAEVVSWFPRSKDTLHLAQSAGCILLPRHANIEPNYKSRGHTKQEWAKGGKITL
jgi:hypothetical protein